MRWRYVGQDLRGASQGFARAARSAGLIFKFLLNAKLVIRPVAIANEIMLPRCTEWLTLYVSVSYRPDY